MKKIIISLLILGSIFLFLGSANKNIISEANILKTGNAAALNLKSEYNANFNKVKESKDSVYFDIKNATLKDDYITKGDGGLIVLSQQIGNKVRIYVKGDNIDDLKINFDSKNKNFPVNYNLYGIAALFAAFLLVLAQKSYSATIKLKRETISVKSPMQTAMNLNRQLYDKGRKKPEIVLNRNYTNPVKREVYDFEFAKNRKNTKIAI